MFLPRVVLFCGIFLIHFPLSHNCDYTTKKFELVSLLLGGGGWHIVYCIDFDICNDGCCSDSVECKVACVEGQGSFWLSFLKPVSSFPYTFIHIPGSSKPFI